MMKHLLTIVLCLTTLTGLAQEEKIKKSEWWNGNPSYAVPIREVNVTARRPMKEIGIQKTQLDTTILHENIALSMADILTFNTSIFVKQYGRATLSTVAFRGTSPSHTQVTWNGMRINSPMLGMTDFSMIPSYFIDDASLLHGTSSVNEAGGGLGGAVKLSTRPADADGFNLQYTQGVGSFSTFDEFLRLTYGNDRWQTSTRVVYSSSPNDFKYRNYDKNVLILDDDHNIIGSYYPIERNKSGAYHDFHALQEVYYNTGHGDRFGLQAWYVNSKRGLPMLSVDHKENDDYLNQQREQTLRKHPFVGSPAQKVESGRQSRLYPYLDGLRLRTGTRQRKNGEDDPLAQDDQHLLRPGGRRILPRGEVALHGNRFGTPASGTKHRQKHYPDG